MRWIFAFAILVSLDSCVGLAAKPCQELPSSVECITSPESMKIIIARAREIVLASKLQINKKERYGIMKNDPIFGIYPMAGLYCQYYFEWKINNVSIIMQGQGNIYELDGPNYFDKIVGNSV